MSETPEKPSAKPAGKRRIWLKVLLFGSLALNLLIVGVVAGAVLRIGPPAEKSQRLPLRELGFVPYVRALSKEDRREISMQMRDLTGDQQENRDAFIASALLFLQALRAEPYDPAAASAAIASQQARLLGQQSAGQELLLQRLGEMSPARRRGYADRLERAMRRGLGIRD